MTVGWCKSGMFAAAGADQFTAAVLLIAGERSLTGAVLLIEAQRSLAGAVPFIEAERSLKGAQLSVPDPPVVGPLAVRPLAVALVTRTIKIAAAAPLGVAQFIAAARL